MAFILAVFSFALAGRVAGTPFASTLHARAITPLPANAKFDYQIGSPYTPPSGVKVVTRDHSADPVAGLFNICYVNAFQSQPGEASFWKCASSLSLYALYTEYSPVCSGQQRQAPPAQQGR